jgi:hypothetical protein
VRKISLKAPLLCMILVTAACGKGPSRNLRSNAFPITDFPLYVTLGSSGVVRKYALDGTYTVFASGLDNPAGITTDVNRNIYVVEQGTSNRLLKFKEDGTRTVFATGLLNPGAVACDGFGQPYVTQGGGNNIVRASDLRVLKTFTVFPSAMAFGVNDLLISAINPLVGTDEIYWGTSSSAPTTSLSSPEAIAVDMSGRVYVTDKQSADPNVTDGRVFRYRQDGPYNAEVVATGFHQPTSIAIDSSENIFITETAAGQIVLAFHSGALSIWASGLSDPQYLSFTRY